MSEISFNETLIDLIFTIRSTCKLTASSGRSATFDWTVSMALSILVICSSVSKRRFLSCSISRSPNKGQALYRMDLSRLHRYHTLYISLDINLTKHCSRDFLEYRFQTKLYTEETRAANLATYSLILRSSAFRSNLSKSRCFCLLWLSPLKSSLRSSLSKLWLWTNFLSSASYRISLNGLLPPR